MVNQMFRNDTELQLLTCPLPISSAKPRSKRVKVANDKEETASIHERVATGRYSTLQEFLGDIEKASSTAIEGSKTKPSSDQADGTPLTETVNRIAAFKKVLNSLVRQIHVNPTAVKAEPSEGDGETPAKPIPSNVEARTENTVLTLFGNPSNPKQLYSSLQKSVKVPLSSDGQETDKFVEVQPPLRDVALPNGINTTKVSQTNPEAESEPAKRTFGEAFSRGSLPQLEPPRRARSSSRSTWIDTFDAVTNYKSFPGERNNYCLAPLPSGQWLQYGGVTSSPSYCSRRQKGDGDATPKTYEDSLSPEEHPSLLQGVYSSFAPSFDSSGAVVQADSKDLVWWGKRGSNRLDTLLSLPYEEEIETTPLEQPGNIGELDEQTLEEMVKTFNPEDFADNVTASGSQEKEDLESKEMEVLLGDVSELLETLSSYQRIRNLDTSALGGQDASPDVDDASTPSTAERGIYETLKSSLAAMVSNLPPYAVSKLDSDKLADLNISQKVVIENPDYHGTMEKDEYTLQHERLAALATIGGGHRSTPSVSSTGRPRNYQGYNRPYAPAQSFSTPQAYYGGRQPSTPGAYTPGHVASTRPAATPTQRPGYPAQYSQSTQALPHFPRPGQNGYTTYAGQQAPAMGAQAPPQPYTPRSAQPGVTYNAPYGSSRVSSPQKPLPYNSPQARTPYMTPGAANTPQQQQQQQQQQRFPQQPTPYGGHSSSQTASPQASGYSNSAAAVTYARSAAEQAALMDRNKAQLAAANSRQPSSTPQSAAGAEYASASQDQSVTPGSQPNGTPVQ